MAYDRMLCRNVSYSLGKNPTGKRIDLVQTMVPREEPPMSPGERPPTLLRALLTLWRRMLAGLVVGTGRALKTVIALVSGDGEAQGVTPRASVLAGGVAVTVGIALWVVAETTSGTQWLAAAGSALVAAAWVVARLVVMRVFAAQTSTDAASVSRAWGAGALPWVAAGISLLRPLTWALGLVLTVRMLLGAGVKRRDAWFIAGMGFGFEIVGLAAVWLARNAFVAAFLLN